MRPAWLAEIIPPICHQRDKAASTPVDITTTGDRIIAITQEISKCAVFYLRPFVVSSRWLHRHSTI
jgi:hypothetical protein